MTRAAAVTKQQGPETSARRWPRSSARRYSDAERTKILETAKRESLTGAQVRERFGVSMLTYYTWRKKATTSRPARTGRAATPSPNGLEGQVRTAVRAMIREMLPSLVQQEIGALFGKAAGRAR